MDALREIRVKNARLRKVPVDSRMTTEHLLKIVGEAVWAWAARDARETHEGSEKKAARGALERAWQKFDTLPRNTSGCKMWKNSHKPGFPFRPVCYSKTPDSVSLSNTPGKVSRLEFSEGLRTVLGLWVSWCHVDQLIRAMNERVPQIGSRPVEKQSISKATFISALWPFVSNLAFKHLMEVAGTWDEEQKIDAIGLQSCLTCDEFPCNQDQGAAIFTPDGVEASHEQCESVIDEGDL